MKTLKNKSLLILILLTFSFSACEKILMEPNPSISDLAVFDEYSTLVKEKYAMLDFKGVDIDFLSDSIRSTITGDLSDTELFAKLAIITNRLRDGHSSLFSSNGELVAGFDITEGYPSGFDFGIMEQNYIGKDINPELKVLEGGAIGLRGLWGTLPQDETIGYVLIPSWNEEISDEEIETIFSDLKDTKGMIFDQRTNGGGDPSLATKFASYFTDSPVYTGFERFKTGPAKDDFSDSRVNLQAAESNNRYLKPVAVLMDRGVYSASTTFAYSVNPLPNITFIGQRSGGGSGSVADGYLANGWQWSLSTSEFIDHENRHLDDGFDPDIPVVLDLTDTTKDEVIERAIAELQ